MKQFNIPVIKTTTTPTNPPAGFLKIYFKGDWKLYSLDSSWTETDISNWGWGWAVDSVNWQTGVVTLTAADVGAYADTNPSWFISNIAWEDLSTADNTTSQFIASWDNVSELNNDAGYVDAAWAAVAAPIQSVTGTAVDNTDPENPVINTTSSWWINLLDMVVFTRSWNAASSTQTVAHSAWVIPKYIVFKWQSLLSWSWNVQSESYWAAITDPIWKNYASATYSTTVAGNFTNYSIAMVYDNTWRWQFWTVTAADQSDFDVDWTNLSGPPSWTLSIVAFIYW